MAVSNASSKVATNLIHHSFYFCFFQHGKSVSPKLDVWLVNMSVPDQKEISFRLKHLTKVKHIQLIGKWISIHPKFVGSLVKNQKNRLMDEKRDLITIAHYV